MVEILSDASATASTLFMQSVMYRHHSQRENERLAQIIRDQNANKEKQELTHA